MATFRYNTPCLSVTGVRFSHESSVMKYAGETEERMLQWSLTSRGQLWDVTSRSAQFVGKPMW